MKLQLKARRFLYTILADFLFKKGYAVDASGLKIKGIAIIDLERPFQPAQAWVILKRNTDILGVSIPGIVSQGTQDYHWTPAANIHDPELLDKLIKVLDKRKILPRNLN